MIRRSFRNGLGRPRAVWLLCLLLVPSLLLTTACGNVMGKRYPPYRYRLAVEVETPQGLRTGSSVIEVQTSVAGSAAIPSPGQLFQRVKGEAVVVDLPGGQTLFALLRSDSDVDWAKYAYGSLIARASEQEVKARSPDGRWNADTEFDLWMERILASRGSKIVPRTRKLFSKNVTNWPMFVRFRDIRDPGTVERIDPDKLNATFGKGYKVRRVVAERTEDEVTRANIARLPWASAYRDKMLDGASINNSTTLANNLTLRDFISGN